jgi:hypothetical protein
MSVRASNELSIARFEAGEIDPAHFDHAAHIYVAWLYVRQYPGKDSVARFDAALRRFTQKIGASAKYNAMVTWLFMLLIIERSRQDESWGEFRARNTDLFDDCPRMPAS